jgi:transcriptional regulator with XRE-family HTH domain
MLREARLAKGYTSKYVAERLGVKPSYYSRIESGENALGKYARRVARLLGLDPTELEAKAMASRPLPKFDMYLRARYGLDDEAVIELERHFEAVTENQRRRRSP